ncbi:DUF262 and DUF1524 domain-containing protein [Muricoccus pecuniae]|uniref:Uncharacterized protein with ParB-like and HNH nuclease domain/predicted transport protein n=1 Tax=Muricoccus pecuniae TaxID=693023 RepID=A0A840YB40_9PROT|nr:DUF262 and DUF1524 domain-containing protein [Roseomonas pecuniae]MBB5693587.1 uncharacterized protein with ParB-like and HNH nuclease domain/predicted transport protein [Roseomonas pecuniae]
MKATEAKLLDFLKRSPQFVIPIYQRTYSWTERECRQLWQDILSAGRNPGIGAHFVGSVVYVEKGLYQVVNQPPLLVIDGQQRLTTVTLLLEALARALGDTEPLDGFSAKKLRNYFLLNPLEDGDRRYKLVLSQTDKASLTSLVDGDPQPKDHSLRIHANFALFQEWLKGEKDNLVTVCQGIAKLMVVDISLNRDQDNPQLIFESLNSTGRKLSQADLIRNFILMGLEPTLQTRLYEQYWRPMELDFGQEAYSLYFDTFMRHYLTLKKGEIPNVEAVYEVFKDYALGRGSDMDELVRDIRAYAGYYCKMALGAENDRSLKDVFHDIRELRVEVALPFLLELYHDYASGTLSKDEFVQAARLVESYVFRRAVCDIPTNSLNKTFAGFGKALKKNRYLESIQAHFLGLPSYRRFPLDEEFKRALQTKDLYNARSRSYWLRRLENDGRRERVMVEDYTIEHIMPQNENLSPAWRSALGADWQRIHSTYLHTLGNLTLTGYNSQYSDKSFIEKRDMKDRDMKDVGFGSSPLRLNKGLGALSTWDEAAIQERAERLSTLAASVWAAPKLDPAILQAYRPTATQGGYTLADHPQLATGPVRVLFDAFRAQVLALDPCVTEEVRKVYIAFKAETNFVDVIPQARRLRLTLNLKFHEIDDPRGLCKNIAGMGRWGNGEVDVGLASMDELPYVIGLVRQSLEHQMGSVDAI